jgi:hypothetical protein
VPSAAIGLVAYDQIKALMKPPAPST